MTSQESQERMEGEITGFHLHPQTRLIRAHECLLHNCRCYDPPIFQSCFKAQVAMQALLIEPRVSSPVRCVSAVGLLQLHR